MNTTNKLTLSFALFAFLIMNPVVSARAQRSLVASHGLQEVARESPDRYGPPRADTTWRLLFWNEIALKSNARDHARVAPLRPDQGGPLRTARAFAIVHIAMFDAYNAIVGGFESYTGLDMASLDADINCERRRASVDAAIAQAAGDTLIALFPSQAPNIKAIQRADLKTIPDGPAKDAGREIGRRAATAILEKRRNDGSQFPEPEYAVDLNRDGIFYRPNPAFGKWRRDPVSTAPEMPGLALGAFWARDREGELRDRLPFVTLSAEQVRSDPPPDLTSMEYAKAFKEVKRLGGDGKVTPTKRTLDQTIAGIFWAYDGTPFLGTPPRLYNQIAAQISEQTRTRGIELARLLALVNVAMSDAILTCFDTKYREEFWRPVTAIRQGEIDGNPRTDGDPNFVPLGSPASNTRGPNFTPNFPAYTAGHSTLGSALFQTLRRFYRTDRIAFSFISDEFNGVTRDNKGKVRPLVLRHFRSLSQAEEENGQSRIYLGVHWSFDNTEGIKQGRQVADYVFDNSFRRQIRIED
jgi:Vanadium chloroperoxidase N-terminal domain/PAP2 superfamily